MRYRGWSGVRVTLFVSGCTHHCEGCFNPVTWDFQYGQPFTEAVADELLTALSRIISRGLRCLAGSLWNTQTGRRSFLF